MATKTKKEKAESIINTTGLNDKQKKYTAEILRLGNEAVLGGKKEKEKFIKRLKYEAGRTGKVEDEERYESTMKDIEELERELMAL